MTFYDWCLVSCMALTIGIWGGRRKWSFLATLVLSTAVYLGYLLIVRWVS